MTKAYFTSRAIRANEEAVRKMFAARPGDDEAMACKARMGMELGPAYIRAILAEVNRGTDNSTTHVALHSVLGWMIATALAPAGDKDARMTALRQTIANVTMEAGTYLLAGEEMPPGPDTAGEVVGGHG